MAGAQQLDMSTVKCRDFVASSKENIALMLITHDMGVVAEVADRVVVMWRGEKVEDGAADTIFLAPRHPYTQALTQSMPSMDPDHRTEQVPLSGDPPNPIDPPSGCRFHPRCPMAAPVCAQVPPTLQGRHAGDAVSCLMHMPNSGHPRIVAGPTA